MSKPGSCVPARLVRKIVRDVATRTLDDYVGHWLRRAHQSASATLAKHLRDADVTPAQLVTLLRLREAGCISQNELGRLVAMEPANIHRIAGVLLSRKLVLAGKDPADARKTLIRLSSKGRALVEELEPLHRNATKQTLNALSPEERAQLLDLLKRICDGEAQGRSDATLG